MTGGALCLSQLSSGSGSDRSQASENIVCQHVTSGYRSRYSLHHVKHKLGHPLTINAQLARDCCIIARKFSLLRIVAMMMTMMMKRTLLSALLLFLCLISLNAQPKPGADDYNAVFKPLKWRSIGPFRGGRSNCATGVVGDPRTY